jgi:hypothetical protein
MPHGNPRLKSCDRRGSDWLAAELGVPARTVSRILRRHQRPYLADCHPLTGQLIRSSGQSACRYERDLPRELVHMDVKKIGKIPDGGGGHAHADQPQSRARDPPDRAANHHDAAHRARQPPANQPTVANLVTGYI